MSNPPNPAPTEVEAEAPARPPRATPGDGYRWDLDVLRIIAILAVVSIHVFGLILGKEDLRGTRTWHFGVILNVGMKWCVPVFVMVSGALLLRPRMHAAGPGQFLRKRAVRLVPAIIVWHLVYLLLVRRWMFGDQSEPAAILVQFFDGRIYTALYFLWLILGLYFVAPVLSAFLAGGGHRRGVATALVACGWTAGVVAIQGASAELGADRPRLDNILTMFVPYVGLFIAGYAWREPQRSGLRWLWTGLAAVGLMAETVWQYNLRPDPVWLQALNPGIYYSGLVMVASICFFVCVIDLCARLNPGERTQRWLRRLGEATFGVFLCHLLFVALIRLWFPEFYDDPGPVAKTQMFLAVVGLSFALSLVCRQVPFLRQVF